MNKSRILKIGAIAVGAMLMGSVLTACGAEKPQFDESTMRMVQLDLPKDDDEVAIITTSFGTIKMVLYPEYAPNTVANFKALVQEGFYNGKNVYGIEPDVAFLTGSEKEDGSTGASTDGKLIKNEYHQNLWHIPGAVSAISHKSGYGDSRFFINEKLEIDDELAQRMEDAGYPDMVVKMYKKYGGIPGFDRQYTVFGQVYKGMSVVREILSQEVDEETKQPKEPIIIEKIELSTYGEDKASSDSSETSTSSVE